MSAAARWLVPAAVTAVVVGGGVAASASSDATPDLPERSAEDLLVAVAEAEPEPFSGTVRTVAALGLPDLSGLAGAAGGAGPEQTSTDPTAVLTRLLSGENELRVWVGGPEQQRVSLVDDFTELDVVRDGDVVWTYSSSEDTATRFDLAEARADAEAAWAEKEASLTDSERAALEEHLAELRAGLETAEDPFAGMTPDEVARTLLADVEDTEVAVGTPRVVAGRDAYTLTATPQDDETLVGTLEVAVDAETGHVLQVSVGARGQGEPAFVTGFTSLDLTAPDASVFDFSPAPGTTVVEPQAEPREDETAAPHAEAGAASDAPEPVVHGEGWSTVLELAAPEAGADWRMELGDGAAAGGPEVREGDLPEGAGDPAALLEGLTAEVDGGRVLTSTLLSVLLTDDGRVLVGAVEPAVLQRYAG
ncbi:LolA family protein [Aquipuribacter sp. SD81]|uniref:LolA family protein n=1 Tax=Aquipuribacter sp. SD81 TaxID=3127703 RepID=UPI00301B65F9